MKIVITLMLTAGLMCGCGGGGGSSPVPLPPGPLEPEALRSALFPSDWTPAFTDSEGRFLHDFSYAGYRGGGVALPTGATGGSFDIVAGYGADPTGAADSTAAIQAAIDAAAGAGGGTVVVPAGDYRVDGLLLVARSNVVLRGAGADRSRLGFTRHEGMTGKSHLTFRGSSATGLEVPLLVDGAARELSMRVADASGLAVGDDVDVGFVITPEFIAEHGMTGVWTAFNGTWQPFFRREIVAIDQSSDPHRVVLDVPLRYPAKIRDSASLRVVPGLICEVGVRDLALSNAVAWDDAWANDRAHVLELTAVKDAFVQNVESHASAFSPQTGDGAGDHLQSGGIIVTFSKRVTVADCRLSFAEHRGGGGNGYLFEVRQSDEILFRDCVGRRGRHNFIQNWGFGVTGCVWLRCRSYEGEALNEFLGVLVPIVGHSEYHHSLATANLVDRCTVDDGWSALNRGTMSTGAGHTATQCVFWNTTGSGLLRSTQFGIGYVIGTGPDLRLSVTGDDWLEAEGQAADLTPSSLYEAQFEKRTGAPPAR
jgi:hypothetical protein